MKLLLSLIIYSLLLIPINTFGTIEESTKMGEKQTVEEETCIYYMFKVGNKVVIIESRELDRIMKMSKEELLEYKRNVLDKRPHQPRGVTP